MAKIHKNSFATTVIDILLKQLINLKNVKRFYVKKKGAEISSKLLIRRILQISYSE